MPGSSTDAIKIQVEASLSNADALVKQIQEAVEKSLASVDEKKLAKTANTIQRARNLQNAGAYPEAGKLTVKALTSIVSLFNEMAKEAGGAENKLGELTKRISEAKDKLNELRNQSNFIRKTRFVMEGQQAQRLSPTGVREVLKRHGTLDESDPRRVKFTLAATGQTVNLGSVNAKTTAQILQRDIPNSGSIIRELGYKTDKNGQLQVDLSHILKQTEQEFQALNIECKKLIDIIAGLEAQSKNESENMESITVQGDGGQSYTIDPKVVQNANAEVNSLNESLAKYKEEETDRKIIAQQTKDTIEEGTAATEKQTSAVGRAVTTFFGYQMVLRQLRKLWNEAIRTVRELDKQLTNQAIVTGMTREQVWGLVSTYQELADATGLAQTTIAAVTTEYLRQGETLSDALTLTKAAAAAATVAGISATDSVKYLTTAVHGFRLEAEDALEVSDKFAALAAQAATNYEDLAIALSKVASQASVAGMSMDYTLALLTTGLDVTQEAPESIGTALKTVIARMREISSYGKTLEDDMDINQVEDGLNAVGIKLRDANGELRSTEDVLDELGRKWKTLSKNQTAAVAKALAGTRQQSRLVAIMENYDKVLEYQDMAANSIGATTAQQMTYLTGMEAAVNRLQNAYQSLITKVVNSDVVINAVNLITGVLEKIGKFLNTKTGPFAALSLIPTILLQSSQFLNKIKQVANSILLITKQTTAANKENNAAIEEGNQKIQKRQKELETSEKAGQIAGKISAGISALLITISWIEETVKLAKEGVSEIAQDAIDKGKEIQAEIYNNSKTITNLKNLSTSLENLDKQVVKSANDLKDMNETRSQLIEALGLDSNLTKGMKNQALVDRALAEQTRLDKENQKLISKLGDTLTSASSMDWGQEAQNFLTLTGAGAAAGTAIHAGWGTLVGAIAGSATANIQTIIRAVQIADARKKIDELLKTDEGVSQFQTLLNYSYKSRTGMDANTESNIKSIYASMISMLGSDQLQALMGRYDYDYQALSDNLADSLASVSSAINTLNEDNANYVEKIQAIVEVQQKLLATTPELAEAFEALYGNYLNLNTILGDSINLLVKDGQNRWSLAYINEFINALGEDKAKAGLEALVNALESGVDPAIALAEATKNWSAEAVEAAANLLTSGLSMQDVADKQTMYANKVASFRDTQAKWSEMSASDRRAFINDNQDFFNIEGAEEAFKTGQDISRYIALYREKLQAELRTDIENQLNAQYIRLQEAREKNDQEAIQNLEREIKELKEEYEEVNTMFDLSLSDVVNKQNQQIAKLKEMYQAEEEALTKSLEKRREAYEKYFDALEQKERIEEYALKRDQVIASIASLSAGTDATSRNKVRELQKQLKQIEEEEAKNRREEARQAVLENIDTQIENIEKQFDELLNNNEKLLDSMDANTHIQYLQFLKDQGRTSEEIQLVEKELADLLKGRWGYSGLTSFDTIAHEASVSTTTTPPATTTTEEHNTSIMNLAVSGTDYKIAMTPTQMSQLIEGIFSEIKRITGQTFAVKAG